MKKPERIILNKEEIDSLQAQLSACNLQDSSKKVMEGILEFYLWLQWALQETKLSLHRLRALFGLKKTEKRAHLHKKPQEPEDSFEESLEEEETNKEALLESDEIPSEIDKFFSLKKNPLLGHGRMGHEAYTSATIVNVPHETLKAQDACPTGCGGTTLFA